MHVICILNDEMHITYDNVQHDTSNQNVWLPLYSPPFPKRGHRLAAFTEKVKVYLRKYVLPISSSDNTAILYGHFCTASMFEFFVNLCVLGWGGGGGG